MQRCEVLQIVPHSRYMTRESFFCLLSVSCISTLPQLESVSQLNLSIQWYFHLGGDAIAEPYQLIQVVALGDLDQCAIRNPLASILTQPPSNLQVVCEVHRIGRVSFGAALVQELDDSEVAVLSFTVHCVRRIPQPHRLTHSTTCKCRILTTC
jgi:hypothetical protein